MNTITTEELFSELTSELSDTFQFLQDKPEETLESTLKACWFKSAGIPKSAIKAMEEPLPELDEKQIKILLQLIGQRQKNIPLAHLTGRQNFMGIELLSDKRALIPRKETEILGKKALEISQEIACKKNAVNVLDICCGAGNLGLAVAFYNPKSKVIVTDLSHDAVELAKENICFLNLNHRVKAIQGDLFSAVDQERFYGKIDMVICNPPYISTAKVTKMNSEISAHEPVLAFDGGMFGTKIIQRFLSEAPKFLIKGGAITFEVGAGQGEFMIRLCEETEHFFDVEPVKDYMGNIRVIHAKKK
ncbi:MAG: peptide chain release factor N(5)-glutamine methyltransferase [Ginsengibacter sp.]